MTESNPPFSISAFLASAAPKESQAPHQVRGDGEGNDTIGDLLGEKPPFRTRPLSGRDGCCYHPQMAWHLIYDLRADTDHVAAVQKATLTSTDYGIEPTHGLFGSAEWWERIADGRLPLHTLKGIIRRVYMASMGDWPEFEMKCDDGSSLQFTRLQTPPDGSLDAFYKVGSEVEVDYVWQNHRHNAPDWGLPRTNRTEIAIRIAT